MTAQTDGEAASAEDFPPDRAYHILVADLIGLKPGADGTPDPSEVAAHIAARGGQFHVGTTIDPAAPPGLHFHYAPDLSRAEEILPITEDGRFDALIAAATFIPSQAVFTHGGVRIGAGTGNMGAASWGGGNGDGGAAPLMNTPSYNSRATAQLAMKAVLNFIPDLPLAALHELSVAQEFDTGKHLKDFPTEKLEGKRLAVLGYGNIGREVALLGRAFGMEIVVYARPAHRPWIESEGFIYAPDPIAAASGAHVLSPHTGLGPKDAATGAFANAGLIDAAVLAAMAPGAVLVNFDRGEVVDARALDEAMRSGQIRGAAIDADVFLSPDGPPTGPLAPYLPLAPIHGDRLLLMPHAAADTDHPSRVAGACQAVDQIFGVICERAVVNRVGTLPAGYVDAGSKTVMGIGKVDGGAFDALLKDDQLAELATHAGGLVEALQALQGSPRASETRREVLLAANRLVRDLRAAGLQGPPGF